MTKLWGGRFTKELAPEAKCFSYSLKVDQELFVYDIVGTIAHAKMLGKIRILTPKETKNLVKALEGIRKAYAGEPLDRYAQNFEDVHSFIYTELEKRVGGLAKKVHSGRSRNDQVATAARLYLKDKIPALIKRIQEFQKALVQLAERNQSVAIPGYTHLQRAQTVLFSHHLLAYVEMLERDKSRFHHAEETCDELPLGSGALSGSTLPLDREYVRKLLGFKKLSQNSLDGVSSRDFVMETLSSLAILMVHLSRLSEDVILWNSSEFGFVTLRDDYATGSSLMPQKKNPDFFELARGKTGEVIGDLVTVLTLMKGLPLSYNRDMQQDKPALFRSLHTAELALETLKGAMATLEVNEDRCEAAASDASLYATDFLDHLIERGTAFKDAHDQVGRVVAYAVGKNKDLRTLSLAEFKKFAPKTHHDVHHLFSAKVSLLKKKTLGSTSPRSVKKQISFWKKIL